MFSRLLLALIAVALVFPLAQSEARAGSLTQSLCFAPTAAGVVRAYYRALDQHRPAAAKACLTTHYLDRLTRVLRALDPDWTNVIHARIVSLKSRPIGTDFLPPDVRPLPYRAVQVGAQVVMRYRRIGGAPNGLDTWFIYVTKQRASSPWRIADIGGGP